jgi:hypothetical protein
MADDEATVYEDGEGGDDDFGEGILDEGQQVYGDTSDDDAGDEAPPERPDYLLDDHQDAESQARAYSELRKQYAHDDFSEIAKWGNWARDQYRNNPRYRQVMDAELARRQYNVNFEGNPQATQGSAAGTAAPKVYQTEQEQTAFAEQFVRDPASAMAPYIQAAVQRATAPLMQHIQTLNNAHANQRYEAAKEKIAEMSPRLKQMVAARQISLDAALALHEDHAGKKVREGVPPKAVAKKQAAHGRFVKGGGKHGSAPEKPPSNFEEIKASVKRDLARKK